MRVPTVGVMLLLVVVLVVFALELGHVTRRISEH